MIIYNSELTTRLDYIKSDVLRIIKFAGDIHPERRICYIDLLSDLLRDEFDAYELIMTLEREFDVVLDDDEIANIETVSDLVSVMERLTR